MIPFRPPETERAGWPSLFLSPGCSFSTDGITPKCVAGRVGVKRARRLWPKWTPWKKLSWSTAGTAGGICAPYDAHGDKVGSSECPEGKIFIEPQGFCSMAGIGESEGFPVKALDSAAENLGSDHGMVILWPAYTQYHLELGEISSYPPGYKENGGIFCHNNPWVIIGETTVGRGEKAWDHYTRIAPAWREEMSEVHRTEPYVYAQMIAGKEAGRHGEAKNSWLTGTAAWNFVAVSQHILGVRPHWDGLEIDPLRPRRLGRFYGGEVFPRREVPDCVQERKPERRPGH